MFTSSQDNVSTSNTKRAMYDDRICEVIGASSGASVASADFDGFTSTGFDLDWSTVTTTFDMFYITVKGGQWECGTEQTKGSTGTQAYTTTFEPSGLLVFGNTSTSLGSVLNNAFWNIGFSDGVDECSHSGYDEDNLGTTESRRQVSETYLLKKLDVTGGSATEEASVDSFNALDFTLNFNASGSSNNRFHFLVVGDEPAAGPNVEVSKELILKHTNGGVIGKELILKHSLPGGGGRAGRSTQKGVSVLEQDRSLTNRPTFDAPGISKSKLIIKGNGESKSKLSINIQARSEALIIPSFGGHSSGKLRIPEIAKSEAALLFKSKCESVKTISPSWIAIEALKEAKNQNKLQKIAAYLNMIEKIDNIYDEAAKAGKSYSFAFSETCHEEDLKAFTHSSSFVGNVKYNPEDQSMEIILNGKKYNFCNVPERVFEGS